MAKIDNDLHLSPDVFRKMSKLRLLKIYNVQGNKVYLRQNLQSLPHTLRYLHWEGYPSKRLPSKFDPQNLVQINMPYNQLEQLSNEVQGFDNLKSIDLRHSIHLIQFPDFSHAPKLEKINLQCSTSFSQVPWHSLQNLDKLTHLNLSHCRKLQTLPMIMTRSLASLDLSSTAIEYLTSSICSLNNLSELNLNECRRLANLPSKINELDSLKYLKLSGCSALQKFPELPRNIIELDIRGTAIKEVTTASIEGRFDLTRIYLSNCRSLETLPTNIFRLRSLAYLDLEGCSKLKKLPKILEPMTSLKKLYLQRTGIRLLPLSIGNLIGLQLLDMDMCEQLESLPSSIANMSRLWKLMLSNCPKLEYFPRFSGSLSSDLEVLYLNNSNVIEIPDSIKEISKLRELYVSNCKNLRSLPELPLALQILDASGCESLKVVLNSRRALKQKFWDDYHVTEGTVESSIFYDCLKLDKKERDNIIIDFQLRVLRMATQFVPLEVQWFSPTVRACCPGNEIPKWFEHQWEGSSINVKLPPQWHDTNFLGFVVCVVGESYSNTQALDLFCEFNHKSDEGEIRKFTWWFTKLDVGYEDFPFASNSSHVYMWYEHQDYHKCLYAKEASFYFSFKEWNEGEDDWIESSESHVNKCGIHMLYRQELEEFNSLKNQHDLLLKESNAIPNQDESSARGTVVSDTDEPNPKRTKY
ncbi:hypothetical protein TIFTF001_003989 [Ficus carica]|uniref:Uncharacterized protein n=1 Tax=Ficus carica TaxID=3494 RepID=A0AA88CV81_FICCA|nr:hypothetical protein TIFTF001_003989 [Ficus carica]